MGTLLCSCVKVCGAIELLFGVASGMGPGIGILDGGQHPQGRFWGSVLVYWFEWYF